MQVIVKDKIVTLGVRFYRRKEKVRELVDELIVYAKQHLKIDVVLLDRGFREQNLLTKKQKSSWFLWISKRFNITLMKRI